MSYYAKKQNKSILEGLNEIEKEKIRQQIFECFEPLLMEVPLESTLLYEWGFDDLDKVEWIMEVEKQLDVLVEDPMPDALIHASTFGEMVDILMKHI
jgi:acyl carrier protein